MSSGRSIRLNTQCLATRTLGRGKHWTRQLGYGSPGVIIGLLVRTEKHGIVEMKQCLHWIPMFYSQFGTLILLNSFYANILLIWKQYIQLRKYFYANVWIAWDTLHTFWTSKFVNSPAICWLFLKPCFLRCLKIQGVELEAQSLETHSRVYEN